MYITVHIRRTKLELIRISSDKIKISLTKAELDAYELSVDSMDYGRDETKEAFRELFIEAREQTGFEADGEKVFVQIFRAKNGGCEIFVSKIGISHKKALADKNVITEIFAFESLDGLISTCVSLKRCGFNGSSSAYADGERYYLMLCAPTDLEIAYATEQGERVLLPPIAYINEHFDTIRASDAVDILSQY